MKPSLRVTFVSVLIASASILATPPIDRTRFFPFRKMSQEELQAYKEIRAEEIRRQGPWLLSISSRSSCDRKPPESAETEEDDSHSVEPASLDAEEAIPTGTANEECKEHSMTKSREIVESHLTSSVDSTKEYESELSNKLRDMYTEWRKNNPEFRTLSLPRPLSKDYGRRSKHKKHNFYRVRRAKRKKPLRRSPLSLVFPTHKIPENEAFSFSSIAPNLFRSSFCRRTGTELSFFLGKPP